ncbi:MAG: Yip1 family protein [Caulobacterales bacterium]
MTVVEGPKSGNIVTRIQNILLKPKEEWAVIDAEPATVQGLYVGYAAILALIPAIATIIGRMFPVCILGVCVQPNIFAGVLVGVLTYVASLVGVYVSAFIANELAANFGGQKNFIQALKATVYAYTAAWLAGVFGVIPVLAILSIVGLYSLYLYWLGLPRLMKVPEDKAVGYVIVSIVVTIVVEVVLYAVVGFIGGMAVIGGSAIAIGAAH